MEPPEVEILEMNDLSDLDALGKRSFRLGAAHVLLRRNGSLEELLASISPTRGVYAAYLLREDLAGVDKRHLDSCAVPVFVVGDVAQAKQLAGSLVRDPIEVVTLAVNGDDFIEQYLSGHPT